MGRKLRLRFRVNDLVLVRYSTYPLWPGTVQENVAPGCNRYADVLLNKVRKESLCYWIAFPPGDKEGGWVADQDIVRYHPELESLVLAPHDVEWYQEQIQALRFIRQQYDASDRDKPPSPALEDREKLQELVKLYERGDDTGDIVDVVYIDNNSNKNERT